MRSKLLILLAGSFLIFSACSTSKLTSGSKTNAEALETSGNYSQAVTAWSQYFLERPIEQSAGEDFAHAAKTALKAGNTEQAVIWFDQARFKDYSDPEMYESLASIYQSQDNLSKELSALETYADKFGTSNSGVNQRLFSIYNEIGEVEKAFATWNLLSEDSRSEESNLAGYFNLNKKNNNETVCDSVAMVLLRMNPEQTNALDWMAKKYYWAGQNRYDREMRAYEENKTRKQYNVLLKELDLVTADFKKALPYLEKLWKQNPGKEYASYFANIYARFGDENKVAYYKKFTE